MLVKVKVPEASVEAVRSKPLTGLWMVTAAPGITAPEGSFTVPATVPAPPELPLATPAGKAVMPRDKIRINNDARLPTINLLLETHLYFSVESW
jgi:hypothetical protein